MRNIVIILLFFVVVSVSATKLIYDSTFKRYDPAPDSVSLSQNAGQAHPFQSGANLLQGYLYPAEGAQTLTVIVPGYRAVIEDYTFLIDHLLQSGRSVFIFDTTGSGESEGSSCVGFPQVIPDLYAALDYICENDSFGHSQLILLGHSRGGYAACSALKQYPEISAVISVSAPNSAMEAVTQSAYRYVGPLAYCNYPFLWLYQCSLFGDDLLNTDAAQCLSGSAVPALVIHGQSDKYVPLERGSIHAHEEEIDSEIVDFYTVNAPGQDGHNTILLDESGMPNAQVLSRIDAFINNLETGDR